jgi:hypothetical protein
MEKMKPRTEMKRSGTNRKQRLEMNETTNRKGKKAEIRVRRSTRMLHP